MLRMSKLTDYAALVMAHLAVDPERVHAAHEIALAVRVAQPTVTKVLKTLARAGLLHSHRGTKGGYLLAAQPRQITLAHVVQAMEGPIGLTECGSKPGRCHQETTCATRGNWQSINQVVLDALHNITLDQMARPAPSYPVNWMPRREAGQISRG